MRRVVGERLLEPRAAGPIVRQTRSSVNVEIVLPGTEQVGAHRQRRSGYPGCRGHLPTRRGRSSRAVGRERTCRRPVPRRAPTSHCSSTLHAADLDSSSCADDRAVADGYRWRGSNRRGARQDEASVPPLHSRDPRHAAMKATRGTAREPAGCTQEYRAPVGAGPQILRRRSRRYETSWCQTIPRSAPRRTVAHIVHRGTSRHLISAIGLPPCAAAVRERLRAGLGRLLVSETAVLRVPRVLRGRTNGHAGVAVVTTNVRPDIPPGSARCSSDGA